MSFSPTYPQSTWRTDVTWTNVALLKMTLCPSSPLQSPPAFYCSHECKVWEIRPIPACSSECLWQLHLCGPFLLYRQQVVGLSVTSTTPHKTRALERFHDSQFTPTPVTHQGTVCYFCKLNTSMSRGSSLEMSRLDASLALDSPRLRTSIILRSSLG